MPQYDGSIRINTKIDEKGFNQGTKNINKGVNNLNSNFLKLGKTIVATFAVKALTSFAKQAVSIASDLQEVQNVVNVSFGNMSSKIEQFSKKAIYELGMSELSFKQFASSFMVMGKSMGIATDDAFGMSVALTKLVGDMASFYNISQDVANTALKSIYTGETETLKKYGIVMTEVNLENFALKKGISKTIQEMSQAEKTYLRYLYVTEQLSMANGDFVRTQESWANQTRILTEKTKELSGIIGEDLINVLTPCLKALNQLITYTTYFYTQFRKLYTVTEEISDSIDKTSNSEQNLAESIDKVTESTKKSLVGLDDLSILQNDLAKNNEIDFGLDFSEIEDFSIGENIKISDNLDKTISFIDEFIEKIDTLYTKIEPNLNLISDSFVKLSSSFEELYKIAQPLLEFFSDVLLFGITNTIDQALVKINGLIITTKNLIDSIVKLFSNFGNLIEGIITGNWELIGESLKNIFDSTFKIILSPLNVIKSYVNGLLTGIENTINFVIDALNSLSVDVPDWIPLIGGQKWGFNIPKINIPNVSLPSIPYLAKGAVIPPNSEFMAVLGDQKTGTNIETPESLLRQIYREESGNSEIISLLTQLISAVKENNIYLDGRKLARGLYDYNQEMIRIKGGNY